MSLQTAVETCSLQPEEKVYLQNRYLQIVKRYRSKYHQIHFVYKFLRMSVMVGSILIPALLTLQKDPTYIISLTTYWTVFILSICVTLSNSIMELFHLSALNTKYWLHVQRLETEGWQFLNLTERYQQYSTLGDAFKKFTSRVERIHLSFVFDLLRLENKNKSDASNGASNNNTNNGGVDTTSINGSLGSVSGGGYGGNNHSNHSNHSNVPGGNNGVSMNRIGELNLRDDTDSVTTHESKKDITLSLDEFHGRLGATSEKNNDE